ncbi:hypothetical protein [Streptomyces sp. NPDC059262]|uniref:hypothetical protein n=1 Tax=Streptomyces sp. NPDC059262 TaxID=3346797 RepID=UPI003675BB23
MADLADGVAVGLSPAAVLGDLVEERVEVAVERPVALGEADGDLLRFEMTG